MRTAAIRTFDSLIAVEVFNLDFFYFCPFRPTQMDIKVRENWDEWRHFKFLTIHLDLHMLPGVQNTKLHPRALSRHLYFSPELEFIPSVYAEPNL